MQEPKGARRHLTVGEVLRGGYTERWAEEEKRRRGPKKLLFWV
jgi:hypothetical protein